MKTERTVVWVQREAPAKPAWGAPCNGCGLCCLSAPCPLGMLVTRRRTGPCQALRWDGDQQRHLCGLIASPSEVTGWKAAWMLGVLQAVVHRQIAAGTGCDASIDAIRVGEDAI